MHLRRTPQSLLNYNDNKSDQHDCCGRGNVALRCFWRAVQILYRNSLGGRLLKILQNRFQQIYENTWYKLKQKLTTYEVWMTSKNT